MTCSVASCDRPQSARGWCAAHYMQWSKTGTVSQSPIRHYARSLNLTVCAVEDCDRPNYARGWCRRHYACWNRTGSPVAVARQPRACSVPDCGRQLRRNDMCDFHLRRVEAGVPLDTPHGLVPVAPCAVEGCDRSARTKRGWCTSHYNRWRIAGAVGGPAFRKNQPIPAGEACEIDGCTREVVTRGWCNKHYKRWLAGRDVTAERRAVVADFRRSVPEIQADSPCASDGCSRRARSRGLCQSHYHQQRRIALSRTA